MKNKIKSNKYVFLGIGILTMAIIVMAGTFTGIANTFEGNIQKAVTVPISYPEPIIDINKGNYTQLEIFPRNLNLRLQTGETKEILITVKNKENKDIEIEPFVVIPPYGDRIMNKEWIQISPDKIKIPSGESQKFKIKVSIPTDASIGFYNAMIVFTNETFSSPSPYPESMPGYVHSTNIYIDVWTPPQVQIYPRYISDMLETGKEYDYEIKLKNIANREISINPIVGSEVYYTGYGIQTLSEKDVTIKAPSKLKPNSMETVKIHVKVPDKSRGYFNGYIDLGIDDPSIRDYEGRVSLNFNIWEQPTKPFVKNFVLDEDNKITVEVSSYQNIYPNRKDAKEPTFLVSIEDTKGEGKKDLKLVKKTLKGNVNIGVDIPPWINNEDIYQENNQYVEAYTIDAKKGEYKLSIFPKYTQGFEYSINIGQIDDSLLRDHMNIDRNKRQE